MNPNSLCFWWPKIENLGIPVPKTSVLPLDADWGTLAAAAGSLGYPVFLRTDLCSGKHDWKSTCFVQSKEDLPGNMKRVLEANERWLMLGIEYQAIVLREFLELETSFYAFSGDMPINKERRFFVKDGRVLCHHPYWPEDAFNLHPARMAKDVDWKEKLGRLNRETNESVLHEYAEKVSRTFSGYWSVDFAKAKNGKWYLLDMAVGENSYHWPNCEAKL